MKKFNGALLVGTLCAAIASNAFADEETFEATFTYNKAASMEANYDSFQRQAKKACYKEISREGRKPISIRARMETKCRKELLTKAVNATRSEILIAHHERKMKAV